MKKIIIIVALSLLGLCQVAEATPVQYTLTGSVFQFSSHLNFDLTGSFILSDPHVSYNYYGSPSGGDPDVVRFQLSDVQFVTQAFTLEGFGELWMRSDTLADTYQRFYMGDYFTHTDMDTFGEFFYEQPETIHFNFVHLGSSSNASAYSFVFTATRASSVPEPSTMLLLGSGLLGLVGLNRRRKA